MSYTKKSYAGAAETLHLNANIAGTDTTLTSQETPSGNWPTGAGGAPFVIRMNPGGTNEEKILVGSRSGSSFTSLTRGYDGTSAATHSAGEVIEHDWDGVSAQEANDAVVNTLGRLTAAGQLLVSTSSTAFGVITAPAGANLPLVSTGITGAGWSQLTAGGIANATITDVQVAAANKDGAAGTASLRTLGSGAQQAMAGNTTLDAVAAPAANVGLNSKKIVNLANGSAASDAAAFGQIPVSASGDVTGSYAGALTVVKVQGVSWKSGTPADANIPIYSSAGTDWEPQALSGDAMITRAGVLTIGTGAVTAAKIANGAVGQNQVASGYRLHYEGASAPTSPAPSKGDTWTDTVNNVDNIYTGSVWVPLGQWAKSWTTITDTVLGADTASFDFTSIPQTFTHLRLLLIARSTAAATTDAAIMRFNNDSGSNYDWADNVGTGAGGTTSQQGQGVGNIFVGDMTAASAGSNYFGQAEITIVDYTSTSHYKMATSLQILFVPSSIARVEHIGGQWHSTAAITRITVLPTTGPNWLAGSRCSLQGIL